ncbi:hypothetical protein IIA79_00275 [bacterium]|nr:hypothetical protein [bacterium]
MARYFPVLLVLCTLIAAALGYATAQRYAAPQESGEERLRQRAEALYTAQRLFDVAAIGRIFTPARQHAETDELLDNAAKQAAVFKSFKHETREELKQSAATISGADLEVELEGDWAVTWGKAKYYMDGIEIPITLEKVVWMRSGGEWWVYQMTDDELIAYGNPPDFAREPLTARGFDPNAMLTLTVEPPASDSGDAATDE